jgi:signal transduction histidine kinase
MIFFKNLTTSRRTSIIFALVNLFFMIVLLLTINLSYFYLWYEDQKAESLYDMNKNYTEYTNSNSWSNIEAFKDYILTKDTIIIAHDSESEKNLECSNWVATKIHDSEMELEELKDSYFYKNESDGKIYFIFSQTYDEIGTVKVLFDTTPYIKSQILIIKITLVIILISLLISYLVWKLFAKYTLRDLRKISQEAKNMTLDSYHEIQCEWCQDDEVKILANTINQSILKIKRQSQDLKQFITDVSHEFKTPLMVINSKIDLYRKLEEKWKSQPEDFDKLLDTIKDRTKKLNNILETLFLLSRKTEGIEKLDYERIDLSKYLPVYVDDYLANTNKKINIIYDFKNSVWQKIDKNIFNIIIDNLVSNAVKFSEENGTIKIWWNKHNIWIKDYGTGMEEKILKNIWDKFYRADVNREWFWVGLFIVSRIISLFKWKIDVTSEKNKGSKFVITFNN